MARPDGRIEKGQRLGSAISARAWNRAQDAADAVLGVRPGANANGQSYGSAPYEWVYAKNGTGSDISRWGVMAIAGVEVTPTTNDTDDATKQFQLMPVLTGGTPSATTRAWCVAVEPIKSNSIGRVAVSGVVQVKASIGNSSHRFVRAKASTSELESADIGEGLLLWSGSQWALVRIGALDLTKYAGYTANKQQVLTHAANGGLTWVDTTACS